MSVSFKDYVIISDAFREVQLEEGKLDDLWNAVKKKLGGKASDEEVKSELERLQKIDDKTVKKIGQTQQSRDFHARKAAQAMTAKGPQKPEPTRGTLGQPKGALANAVWDSSLDSRDRRVLAKMDRIREEAEALVEGIKEYRVEYVAKAGGSPRIAKIKAVDVMAAREKFKRDFHGMRLVTVEPAKVIKKRVSESHQGKTAEKLSAAEWLQVLRELEDLTDKELSDVQFVTDRIKVISDNEGSELKNAAAMAAQVVKLAASK